MGLLPDKRPISWYDPGKFWSGDHIVRQEPTAGVRDLRLDRVIGVGVIGAGLMGSTHARILRAVSGARVVAVADPAARPPSGSRRREVDARHADALELIAAAGVDAVVIASPGLHPRAVRARRASRRASGCCARSRSPRRPRRRCGSSRPRPRGRRLVTVGVHAPLRPGLRRPEGQAGRGRDRRCRCSSTAPTATLVHEFFDSAMIITDTRGPRGRHRALAAGRGDRGASPSSRRARRAAPARVCATRSCSCSRRSPGVLVDVEAFVSARLRLRHPLRGGGGGGTLAAPARRRARASSSASAPPTSRAPELDAAICASEERSSWARARG